MKYKEIKLNVSNDNIKEYKLFNGLKIYSEMLLSKDRKTLTYKRIYVTEKHNYVYYERTDLNWNYWSDKTKWDSTIDINEIEHHTIFEVSANLNDYSKYLGAEMIEKLILQEKNGEMIERLDI